MKYQNFLRLIGSNIKHARLKADMKGETLAKNLGMSKSTVSLIENGLVDIKISTLHKISELTKQDICSLIAETKIESHTDLQKIELNKFAFIDVNFLKEILQDIKLIKTAVEK